MKTNWSQIFGQLTMVAQLGLSLATPLLMCLLICYLLTSRLGLGVWVYLPGFILGLGSSAMSGYKMYLAVMKKEEKEKKDRGFSSNKHI